MTEARRSFQFYQVCRLTELTGERATTIRELRAGIARVPAACIFYHTHHAFLRAHRIGPDYTNDFARWVTEAVQAFRLGERLGGVDVLEYRDLEELRKVFLDILDEDIAAHGAQVREAPPTEPFYFVRARTILYPLDARARNLAELAEGIATIPVDSLFYHFFEARLGRGGRTNDFSHWLETELGEPALAMAVERIDPYVLSLEELRGRTLGALAHSGKAA
jgi:hypothetical protein